MGLGNKAILCGHVFVCRMEEIHGATALAVRLRIIGMQRLQEGVGVIVDQWRSDPLCHSVLFTLGWLMEIWNWFSISRVTRHGPD